MYLAAENKDDFTRFSKRMSKEEEEKCTCNNHFFLKQTKIIFYRECMYFEKSRRLLSINNFGEEEK